ncbi:BolA family transcriptional regulator [Pelistega indica]|uniref:BolA family transcriptional regulator n=1 Tax=Pelistega indica TaxID=1414851 RepID=V8FVQ2_9BURK|nr:MULTISPECIES: BolA family protein [Pelistega]ETD67946.1 BolA family transcriptional regulator [Pelistega indica]
MTSNPRADLLKERLQQLDPLELIIEDESHLHAGHAGSRNGASHFRVTICSEQFRGLTRVAQQRLVFDTLNDLLPYPIHALALITKIPS